MWSNFTFGPYPRFIDLNSELGHLNDNSFGAVHYKNCPCYLCFYFLGINCDLCYVAEFVLRL